MVTEDTYTKLNIDDVLSIVRAYLKEGMTVTISKTGSKYTILRQREAKKEGK